MTNFTGTAGNDILPPTGVDNSGDDIFHGLGGDDVLIGGAGADLLDGGAGRDLARYDGSATAVQVSLATGLGHGGDAEGDTLQAIEDLRGSSHNDALTGNGGNNILDGAAGNDILSGGAGDDWLLGGAGADNMDGGVGRDMARYSGSLAGVTVNLATSFGHGGDAEGDTLHNIEDIRGSSFADTLTGNALANILDGSTGNDTLAGAAGDDWLLGGAGADTLDGGAGAHDMARYSGSLAGVQVDLAAGTGHGGDAEGDILHNIEDIRGTSFADTLTGDAQANTLDGSTGNDTLVGGGGDDWLLGGTGADNLDGGAGADDMARYSDSPAGVQVDLAAGIGHGGDAEGDTLHNIEDVWATSFNDTLTGDAGVNTLYGLGGDDTLIGGAGDDQLYALSGHDILIGGAGADFLFGGEDHLSTASYAGSSAGVTVSTTSSDGGGSEIPGSGSGGDAEGDLLMGIVNLIGSDHDDTLRGALGANILDGGGGNDLLIAQRTYSGESGDTLIGGAGDDVLNASLGPDQLIGGDGADTADFGAGTAISANLATGEFHGGAAEGDTLVSIENLSGSFYNDTLTGDAGNNILMGQQGNDILVGGAGADRLDGGSSPDNVTTGDMASYASSAAAVNIDMDLFTFHGGDAEGDTIVNVEAIRGSAFDDTLASGSGVLTLYGGDGDDHLVGNSAGSRLNGGAGADTLDGVATTAGHANLADYADSSAGVTVDLVAGTGHGGDAEGDVLHLITGVWGSDHADTLTGGTFLRGAGGDDILIGTSGADQLYGGAGADTLTGGNGSDSFIFEADIGAARDTITDFSHAQADIIDLSAIDANTNAAENQSFTFIGSGAFSGVAGQLHWVADSGGVVVEGDTNGDGAADFAILLQGVTEVRASDFSL